MERKGGRECHRLRHFASNFAGGIAKAELTGVRSLILRFFLPSCRFTGQLVFLFPLFRRATVTERASLWRHDIRASAVGQP